MNQSIKELLAEIGRTQAYDKLEPFREARTWSEVAEDDRELLALLFVEKGKKELEEGSQDVLTSFSIASKIAPKSAEVAYRQGINFALYPDNQRCLQLASELLEQAVMLNPTYFDAWHAKAKVLVRLGLVHQDTNHLREAETAFHRASKLGTELSPEFFCNWGLCWCLIGKQSGEAYDFRVAVGKYREAIQLGLDLPVLWNDYGAVLGDLATLLRNQDMFYESIACYQKAVERAPQFYQGWSNLGAASFHLFTANNQEEDFSRGHAAFERATTLEPSHADDWARWGALLTMAARRCHRPDLYEAACERYEKADALQPDSVVILSGWAEAQMLNAELDDRLDLLKAAQHKVSRCLDLDQTNSRSWYLYGCIFVELGRYFSDEHYLLKAIEHLRTGLALDDSDPQLWHAAAVAYHALSDLRADPNLLDVAITYFSRSSEFGGDQVPQFMNDWAVALMRRGEGTGRREDIEAALEKLERALGGSSIEFIREEVDPEWIYNYGCAWDYLGDFSDEPQFYERAVQMLSHVLVLEPEFRHARFNLALAYSHLGELTTDIDCFEKAVICFKALLEEDPEDEVAWNEWGLTLINLARMVADPAHPHLLQSAYDHAETRLQQAVSLGSTQAFYNLACLYSLTHKYSAAMHFLEKAESMDALPTLDELMQDEWLENFRKTEYFKPFIDHLLTKYRYF